MKSAGAHPALFCCAVPILQRSIVAAAAIVVQNKMVPDQTSIACLIVSRIVIDDRSRLPGRFFGRFATSATSELSRAL
jgi:hypothetical protein